MKLATKWCKLGVDNGHVSLAIVNFSGLLITGSGGVTEDLDLANELLIKIALKKEDTYHSEACVRLGILNTSATTEGWDGRDELTGLKWLKKGFHTPKQELKIYLVDKVMA